MDANPHIAAIRFGLGLRPQDQPPANPLAWLEGQLGPERNPPTGHSSADGLRAQTADLAEPNAAAIPQAQTRVGALLRDSVAAWGARRLTAAEPFRERLVDFWLNHFAVSRRVAQVVPVVGPYEREAIRPHILGKFEDLTVAAVLHPAMLRYLDNAGSVGPNSRLGLRSGRGLNENLAREVLELHTLSPAGGYTQGDVQELAKILTGWGVERNAEPLGARFVEGLHEPNSKTLLGRRFEQGPASAEQALRFLARHPATHRHIAVKLARHFVADTPPPAAVRAIEQALRDSGGDLGAATRALLRVKEAWDPPLGKFRDPRDYVLATMRCLGAGEDDGTRAVNGMNQLNQPLWMVPAPIGWPDTRADWAAPEELIKRVEFAHAQAGRFGRLEPLALAETVMGPLLRADTLTAMRRAGSVRDALTLLLGSPEFMRR